MRHPTAVIHPGARLDASVEVGPYAVIEEGVVLGPGCVVGPYVHLAGRVVAGARNRFHAGCVIGDAPQDLKYDGAPTEVRIGEGNTFREHVTVNRASRAGGATVIGSHNFLMASAHVGHDCTVGDHVIMANGALLGGHVQVGDRAFLSGISGAHQFVRIGTLALMQGTTAVTKDLPPYCMARDVNRLCGLNTVGLRRAGIPGPERMELRRLYHELFRGRRPWKETLVAARGEYTGAPALALLEFVAGSKRGVCADPARRRWAGAAPEAEDADQGG
ncbi:MAG: hypothetical protein RJA22_60 [Verrucomicrobiota bacterium]|jgi:UDP-N-acetylglucosamine acyltransferase